ncbi:MAG: DUF455 family protein [Myxococcota bacterium]
MGTETQLRSWAERVLFGTTLADKQWAPRVFDDDEQGSPIEVPSLPGRPRGLAPSNATTAVPSDAQLHDAHARGRLLHMFANHELLAMELMALSLLRFVDAPRSFRRGLAHALKDEQRHFGLYLERMKELGVELGEQPLSGFFWRVMAPMPSPLDFVAHMSLTFEQANLDFARSYAQTLRACDDPRSARILDEVYDDEVGHVRLGRVWFDRWRPKGPSLFEAHRQTLRSPVTPRRARGLGFDREGRRRAGFPADYVDRVSCFESSRGRPPVVHLFEPTAELELGTRAAFTPKQATRAMIEDLELLPAFAAAPEDVVALHRGPSPSYLTALRERGIVLPEWIERAQLQDERRDPLPPRLAELRPWGWAPRARACLGGLAERCMLSPPPPESDAPLHAKTEWASVREALVRELNEPWLDEPHTLGIVVRDAAEARAALNELQGRGYDQVVLKAPFGTSGRGSQRSACGSLDTPTQGWLDRTLAIQGAVLIEPWLDRVGDVSLRITVLPSGEPRIDGLGRFLTDRRGQYLGALLGPITRAWSPEVARWLHDDGRDPKRLSRVTDVVARAVAARAHRLGYHGPIGIDGLIYRDREGALHLRPMVEVNVRPNFGHVVHGLGRRLARGCAGMLVLARLSDLPEGGAHEAIARAEQALPVELDGEPARMRRGVIALTDPARAQTVLALVLVAGSKADAFAALESAAPAVAARLADVVRVPSGADSLRPR